MTDPTPSQIHQYDQAAAVARTFRDKLAKIYDAAVAREGDHTEATLLIAVNDVRAAIFDENESNAGLISDPIFINILAAALAGIQDQRRSR